MGIKNDEAAVASSFSLTLLKSDREQRNPASVLFVNNFYRLVADVHVECNIGEQNNVGFDINSKLFKLFYIDVSVENFVLNGLFLGTELLHFLDNFHVALIVPELILKTLLNVFALRFLLLKSLMKFLEGRHNEKLLRHDSTALEEKLSTRTDSPISET